MAAKKKAKKPASKPAKAKPVAAKAPHENKNLMGALAYLLVFITGIALLLTEKKDSYVRFHAAQSTVAFGALFILSILLTVTLIGSLIVGMVSLLLWLFLMWKAYNGERYELPYIQEWVSKAEKQIRSS